MSSCDDRCRGLSRVVGRVTAVSKSVHGEFPFALLQAGLPASSRPHPAGGSLDGENGVIACRGTGKPPSPSVQKAVEWW